MSRQLKPQKVLSQLEDQKCNELSLKLAELNSRRELINLNVEAVDLQLAEIEKQREQSGQATTALMLSTIEAVRQEELGRKKQLLKELDHVAAEEKAIRSEMFASMNKSKAYAKMMEKDEKMQQKHELRVEQQSLDDLMSHRCTRKES